MIDKCSGTLISFHLYLQNKMGVRCPKAVESLSGPFGNPAPYPNYNLDNAYTNKYTGITARFTVNV
jgi:hypothetical protein